MNKKELSEVIQLVKKKLSRDMEAACGLFWPDADVSPSTLYAVGEEDAEPLYSAPEEEEHQCVTLYGIGECDD